jgi:ubiquinone/menaquinone biosynthesis C-methylase UbiE
MKQSTPAKGYKGVGMEGIVARWYAQIVKKNMEDYRRDARLVAEAAPAGGFVLDLATGPGHLALELAKLGKQQVIGLDVSSTFVRMATKNAQAAGLDVAFQLGDASLMPFEDGTFDFVVCRAAFKNFSDPVAALQEIYRVLKPGGRALILDLRRNASMEAIAEHVARMHLNPVNAFLTRMTFRHLLLGRAYARAHFERFAAATGFARCDLRDHDIEIHAWFTKEARQSLARTGTA